MGRERARLLWLALIAGAAITLVVCRLASTHSLQLGTPAAGWVYGYYQAFGLRGLGVFLLTSSVAALLLQLPPARSTSDEWLRLITWWLFGLAAVWMLRSLAGYTLQDLFASDGANGFYGFAEQHPAAQVLRRFDYLRRLGPLHVQANMPGKLMLVYAMELVTRNPALLALLIVLLSSLGGFLLYSLVRALIGDATVALYAAILYWFYPARLFFLPIMNSVTPVPVLACACLLIWWLRSSRTLAAAILGLALYGLVFFEPLPLVIGLLFSALVLRSIATGETEPGRWTLQACVLVATFIATSEAVHVLTGFELVHAFQQTAAHATAFNGEAGRPYGFWLRGNLVEFLFGLGYCQALLCAGVVVTALSGEQPLRTRLVHPAATLSLGLLATLLAVELIGVNRGEVLRLWIFLGCFFQIPAAWACVRMGRRIAMVTVVACVLLQTAVGIATMAFASPR
jgi:hypothetical protein